MRSTTPSRSAKAARTRNTICGAVCVWYNKDKANLKVPTSRHAISAMALIRSQPRNVQQEVYEFLAKKFGTKPGRR
ncbi:MAG: hypothetical protein SH850_26885 [Planctomycetaceae bacterium]|nr:hypothetical protein [Planctomycetaceae bacterium]